MAKKAPVKKRTSGGKFNRDDRDLYFLASSPHNPVTADHSHNHVLVAVNELEGKASQAAFDELLDDPEIELFLDSGIFALTNQHARKYGVPMDEALALAPDEIDGFDKLWDLYCSLVVKYADRLWGAIELDQGGAANKRITRARIEKETGIVPIPVYHPFNDGWDYFDEIAGAYDRVCFGNVVQATSTQRIRLVTTMYERQRASHPDTWIHLLGYSPNHWLNALPYYGSCDSSTWLAGIRWPTAHRAHAQLQRNSELTFLGGMRYILGDPVTHNRAYTFGGAQSGHFIESTWRATTAARKEAGL